MLNKATFALLLTAGLLTNAFAAEEEENEPPRTYSSERPIETSMTELPLPRSVPGSMTLRPCASCDLVTLALTSTSTYLVGSRPVAYADLRSLAQNASSANVAVFYDLKTNAVTRIVVSDAR
jgi:hypothetical protein